MKKIMWVDLNSGKVNVISEEGFNDILFSCEGEYEEVVSSDGVVSFKSEDDLFIVM